MPDMSPRENTLAMRLVLRGLVQGIGLRPAVAREARLRNLEGFVRNGLEGVEIVVEGPETRVQAFLRDLRSHLPDAADVNELSVHPIEPRGWAGFSIQRDAATGPLHTRVPVDLATCPACRGEYHAPDDRRFQYPLISCTDCGPRYSLLHAMPFERDQTSLREFPLCSRCAAEYADPSNRRFHAQTMACPACGPHLWLCESGQTITRETGETLHLAAQAVSAGRILALRGLGGYQLLVDATQTEAVARLRSRKQRPHKPFAVMVLSAMHAEAWVEPGPLESELLASSNNPIVLMTRKPGTTLAWGVSESLNTLGLMLPTTPLHEELCRLCAVPLVVTSGNCEGDPIVSDPQRAERELAGIADLFLHHGREILRPIDDSVLRVIHQAPLVIRAGRGYAPLPLAVVPRWRLLAVGGQQKNAVALSNGRQAVLAPHGGDLETLSQCRAFDQRIEQLRQLYGFEPDYYVHDAHPEYFSTAWCRQQTVPAIAVQHHHAHIVSSMLEGNLLEQRVLGLAFDGTGWGNDGTLWGGEFLCCTARDFERLGRLVCFRLPGGEKAIREPWRIAASLLCTALGASRAMELSRHFWPECPVEEIVRISQLPASAPLTSSLGRLFDGVGALILGQEAAHYEGEIPMLLESLAADRAAIPASYHFDLLTGGELRELDWRGALREVIEDLAVGTSPAVMAWKFHRGLAEGIARVCQCFPDFPVVFGGGCFQNKVFSETLLGLLRQSGRLTFLPREIPVNDGGLAAGQLAIAAALLSDRGETSHVSGIAGGSC